MNNRLAAWVNRIFGSIVVKASASRNLDSEPVGFMNRAFHYVYQVRLLGKRLKKYNMRLYYTVKYLLFAAVLYLLFF